MSALLSHPALRRYAFLAIPAIAVLELLLHLAQITRRIPDDDWARARAAVKAAAHPEDLVVFAPFWADPLGREHFLSDVATIDREARPDDTRFPRAFEVSIRGAHLAELEGWKALSKDRYGAVSVTLWQNPSPAQVLDDLVAHATGDRAHVSVVEGTRESECAWTRSPPQSGPLGFGPAMPADRFVCPKGGFVAVSVDQTTDYRPHKCIYAPPLGGGAALRLRFSDVQFGKAIHGYHGIDWDQARFNSPPVTLTWKFEGRTLGRLTEGDADGWKPFEIDTSDLEGKRGELVAEITAPTGNHRRYCFEADTR